MQPLTYIRKQVFGLSQAAFAAQLGVHQSTVSRWETGGLEPSREEMASMRELALARRLAWKDEWFFKQAPSDSNAEDEGEAA